MSHYHAEVWIQDKENVEEQLEKILSPYNEESGNSDDKFWDWFQIGGRWKGSHDLNYKQEEDKENKEICRLCHGTGKRLDMNVENGCNGCHGTGIAIKWPTEWKTHSLDIIPVSEVPAKLSCYIVVLPDLKIAHSRKWNGESFVETDFNGNLKEILEKYHIKNGYMVTVDYHN